MNDFEEKIIELIASEEFEFKSILFNQINEAQTFSETNGYFYSIMFKVKEGIQTIECLERVPIEIRLFYKERHPVQILVHIIKGYIAEIEIFRADSSYLSIDELMNYEKKVFINCWSESEE